MPIDFHNDRIQRTYANRTADASWARAMRAILDPRGKRVADVGCGGGIYSRAWCDLGASRVVGVDFSARMVEDAREASAGYPALAYRLGDATATGLEDASMDVVFARALIHHLPDLQAALTEAARVLKPGGRLVIQDRTMQDVLSPASPRHFRGYFFKASPRLLAIERERRPQGGAVETAMRRAGFTVTSTMALPEVRRIYAVPEELQKDLRSRTGRSILHALADDELARLIDMVMEQTRGAFPLEEIDYWTVWAARAPS